MVIVFERKGRKRWHYKLRMPNGEWRTFVGFTDKRATEHRAEEEQTAIDRGEVDLVDRFAVHRHKPIAEHVADYAAALEGRNRTPKHVRMTKTRLLVVLAAMGATNLASLNLGTAEVALGALMSRPDRKGRKLSAKTRDHYRASLREWGGWLVDTGRLPSNPFAKLIRVATDADVRVERQALTGEEVLRLAAAAETRPVQEWKRSHPAATADELEALARNGRRRGLLYVTAALTGLRRAELAGLRWVDLNLGDRPTVSPRPSTTKAKRRDPLPLDAGLTARLKGHREDIARESGKVPAPTDAVFHLAKNLVEQLHKDARWCGLDVLDAHGRRLDLHALRASCATLLATSGVPMQMARRLIRHTDPRLTARHYEKIAVEDLRPGIAMVGAAFWGKAVAPNAAPNPAPLAAAVGCSAPLAEAGTTIAHQSEVASERHATPVEGVACRSVPVADELWRRRESNPRPEMLRPGPLRA
jgi:integrase/recombinase XerC